MNNEVGITVFNPEISIDEVNALGRKVLGLFDNPNWENFGPFEAKINDAAIGFFRPVGVNAYYRPAKQDVQFLSFKYPQLDLAKLTVIFSGQDRQLDRYFDSLSIHLYRDGVGNPFVIDLRYGLNDVDKERCHLDDVDMCSVRLIREGSGWKGIDVFEYGKPDIDRNWVPKFKRPMSQAAAMLLIRGTNRISSLVKKSLPKVLEDLASQSHKEPEEELGQRRGHSLSVAIHGTIVDSNN